MKIATGCDSREFLKSWKVEDQVQMITKEFMLVSSGDIAKVRISRGRIQELEPQSALRGAAKTAEEISEDFGAAGDVIRRP